MEAQTTPNSSEFDQLYNWYAEMTSNNTPEKFETEYLKSVEYLKLKPSKERVLAAQLVSKFIKHYPAHQEKAFESLIDLCESTDIDVRKHAVRALTSICQDCPKFVSQATNIFLQLYQFGQASEINLINQSLTLLLQLDISKFLESFFANFEEAEESIVRGRALKFLHVKLPTLPPTVMTKEIEEQLVNHCKKALYDVTEEEFVTIIQILGKLKVSKTIAGQALIFSMIKSQAELEKPFDINDKDFFEKLLLCARHSLPLLTQYNRASEYVNYFCLNVIGHLGELKENGNDLKVLQTLAEMSSFIHSSDVPAILDLPKCQDAVFKQLLKYIPRPPESEPQPDQHNPNAQSGDFQFSHIEFLLYTFHQFGKVDAEFYNNPKRIEILHKRLFYLHNGCKKYMDSLERAVRLAKGLDRESDEFRLRTVALKTTKNITTLIRDYFKRPVQFKSEVLLSCKS